MRARASSVLLIGGVLVVLAAAVTFGESDQAHRLAEHAGQLAQSERVLSSMSTVRANLGITVVLERTSDLDPVLSDGAGEAWTVLGEAVDRLAFETRALDEMNADHHLMAHVDRIEQELGLSGAAVGEATTEEGARAAIAALDELEAEVIAFRDVTAAYVEAEGGRAGDLARVASYTVALLAPAIALLAFRSVSRRRLARIRREEELRRREEIATAKVDLVAGLSHELRTPLTGIHGFSHTLIDMLDGPGDPDDRPLLREIAGLMVEQTGDLSRMVDDLISFMRLSDRTMSSKPVPVDIETATVSVIEEFSAHTITSNLTAALVSCDPIHLRQMIRNLLSNASRHGGRTIRVTGTLGAGHYTIGVQDDGDGVDPDRGDPFVAFAHEGTTPLTTGSIGMGLSVVRGLAEVSAGSVHYRRDAGWTTFELRLPLSEAEMSEAEDHVFAKEM